MNRTIKDATVKRYFYETHDQLRTHLRDSVDAYNFARRLKTLTGLTPDDFICKAWLSNHQRFKSSPFHKMPGLNRCAAWTALREPSPYAALADRCNLGRDRAAPSVARLASAHRI
jgi:hypothetical protein